MAVSKREMDEFMGAPFVPFTFPTVGVTARMKLAGVNSSWSQVDQLWDAYYLAETVDKLPPYSKDAGGQVKGAIINNLAARTSIAKNTVAAWLNALADEVAENGRGYYLDPAGAEAAAVGQVDPLNHPLESIKTIAKSTGDAAGALVKPSADALTNVIKYGALALVAGAAIYAMWEFTPLFKSKRKRKAKG